MGNIWRINIREIHLHSVCDAPGKTTGLLSWSLFHLDGRLLEAGEKSVFLGYGQSHRQKTLDLSRKVKTYGAGSLFCESNWKPSVEPYPRIRSFSPLRALSTSRALPSPPPLNGPANENSN